MSLPRAQGDQTDQTIVGTLRGWAEAEPGRRACLFLEDGETEGPSLTYGELHRDAGALAAILSRHAQPGDRALLLYPPGLDFVTAFFACLMAGIVAVPVYPPRRKRANSRLRAILDDAEPRLLLGPRQILDRMADATGSAPALARAEAIATDQISATDPAAWEGPDPDPDGVAFLQYTSGSTASPKGVVVGHRNLLSNEELIGQVFGVHRESVVVSWLPLYHDMGLIGAVLQPLHAGATCVLMAPQAFLQRPVRWLDAISRYRADVSGGPDFAYALCADRVTAEDREGLDLSCWRVAFDGAEPVRSATLAEFAEKFAPVGFDRRAFAPCYGLAEATLLVTGAHDVESSPERAFDPAALEQGRAVAHPATDDARWLVSCGRVERDAHVEVVDPESRRPVAPGQVGEIWVSGPGVAEAYWRRPDATAATFEARLEGSGTERFLRTGDLGFLDSGQLFVTGRLKDLIIIRGRNLHPQDIEASAQGAHGAVRLGGVAAVSVETDGGERLVVLAELDRRREDEADQAAEEIRRRVVAEHDVEIHALALLRAGSLPRTSSGKLRRAAARDRFLAGELHTLTEIAGAVPAEPGAMPQLDPADDPLGWLRGLLAEKLGAAAARLGPSESVSDLGIDSISAVEIAHRIETVTGIELSVFDLLAGTTLGALAARIAHGPTRRDELVPAEETAPPEAGTLSHNQLSLWLTQRLEPRNPALNLARAVRLLSPLDPAALDRAVASLAARHPALRTGFVSVDGVPRRTVDAESSLTVRRVEARGWSREAMLDRLADEASRPFDLARAPLVRLTLFDRAEGGPVLLCVLHHLIADYWSVAILLEELGRLLAGTPVGALPAPAATYDEFVSWQHRQVTAGADASWEHWREVLSGELPVLALPTDRPRTAASSWSGGVIRAPLDEELTASLRSLGEARGATLFMTLLAAWTAHLRRLSGQEDLVVGFPTAGRSRAELAGVVGYFVNPLPLRARPRGDVSFERHLDGVRTAVLDALAHQDLPFELLVERLQPHRSPGASPLFRHLFALQKAPRSQSASLAALVMESPGRRARVGPLVVEPVPLARRAAQFDLDLLAAEIDGVTELSFEYRRDLFDPVTVQRLARSFVASVRAAVERPEAALEALSVWEPAERHQVLVEWNDTAAALEAPTLPEGVLRRSARCPDAVAVVADGRTLTYGELARRVDELARWLVDDGVGAETVVGVCLERSPEMVVALLAVMRAGGAYLPLDPDLPESRLAAMVEDSGARRVIVAEPMAWDPAPAGARAVRIGPGAPPLTPSEATLPALEPHGAAYVIYTSGSTGRPKGVVNSHAGIANRLAWGQRRYRLGADERVLQKTPFSFDVSIWELFWPLLTGATLVMARPGGHRDPAYLAATLVRERITTTHFVPSMLRAFLEAPGPVEPDGVRRLLLSGEALSPELVARARERWPTSEIHNLYGPTEAAVEVTAWQAGDRPPTTVPIGRPIANLSVRVHDASGRSVGIGVPGELCLGGVALARGYLGRPALTARSFVPDPAGDGERLYRTGDLARFDARGQVEYLGRLDHQVKVRGFRIELGEIEAALLERPEVAGAVVLARQSAGADARLVAYLVAAADEPVSVEALRGHLEARLPSYMVPQAFVVLDALPTTSSGKVARSRLPEPDWSATAEHVAPRGPVETLLAGVWERVLALPEVGATDDFFALGGHSLLATQAAARIQEALGVEVPLLWLFEHPTPAGLAARLATASGQVAPPPIRRLDDDGPYALSHAQQRIWLLEKLDEGSAFYHMPVVLELEGALDPSALATAWRGLVARHGSLRTRFGSRAGQPFQAVEPPWHTGLPVVDLSGLPAAARDREEARWLRTVAVSPFALARAPLWRLALFRLAPAGEPGRHLVALTLHHLVSDGWSMGILVRELAELYRAAVEDRAADLAPLPIRYVDHTAWQRDWLETDALAAQLDAWTERLAGARRLELPTDRPRSPVRALDGASIPVSLPAELVTALVDLGRRHGSTLFMTLLSIFGALLERWSGQRDLTVGTPVAGRRRTETEGVVGLFVNTLALRWEVAPEESFAAQLGRVRETSLAAFAHQDVPFDRLVEELGLERDLGSTPLFQVMLVLGNAPLEAPALPGLTVTRRPQHTDTAKFDLTLAFEQMGDELTGEIEYATELFDRTTVERWRDGLLGMLRQVAASDGAVRLGDLSPWSRAARHQVLTEWSDTAAHLAGPSLPEEILRRAADSPDALAMVTDDRSLTYGDLARRVEGVARRLVAAGAGAETVVGVCLQRSPELVVALLAVWRAGGVYLPLDPDLPEERLEAMVEGSGARLVIVGDPPVWEPPMAGVGWLRLGAETALDGPDDDPVEMPGIAPRQAAYVIYTSGSTGRPKGVVIHHRSIAERLRWMRRELPLEPDDRLILTTPASFDASLYEILLPLCGGQCLVLPRPDGHKDPAYLVRTLDERGVTLLQLVPSLLGALVDQPGFADCRALRRIYCGGEALPWELVRRLRAVLDVELYNFYGPTEVTIDATYGPVGEAAEATGAVVPIGRPIAGTSVRLLDARGRAVPLGAPGELHVGGTGLARGYLGRPGWTAERFVPDPAGRGARLYRTGDLARFDARGGLEFLGRIDHQVKVRGFRIEPGEIEASLLERPEVAAVAVVARTRAPGDQRLVAYLVAVEGESLEIAPLRAHLESRLPPYMVPQAFVVLDALPRTPSGKLDRADLPDPAWTTTTEHVAPRGPIETLLAGVWEELLGVERAGANDDFFALGGHSLLAAQAVARIQEASGAQVPLRWLFESPTVGALAARLESGGERSAAPPPIRRVEGSGPYPSSHAQQRLWFLEELDPGNPAYHIPVALALDGPLLPPALAAAWERLVERHEALRTRLERRSGLPVQEILPPWKVDLPVVDLSGLDDDARERQAARRLEALARHPFALDRAPLWRIALLRLAPERHLLALTFHHIVGDGWSMGVLMRELATLYAARLAGQPESLPPLPIRYVDHAVWQRRWLEAGELQAQLAYWRERLTGAPTLELPTDRPRPATRSTAGAVHPVRLPARLTDALEELARRRSATLFMALSAGFAALLGRWSGQRELVVGTPVAGRRRVETEGVVGLFVNTLALAWEVAPEETFAEQLQRVRTVALAGFARQDVPFDRLVEELAPQRDLATTPLFQTMLALDNAPLDPPALARLRVERRELTTRTAKFDLLLRFERADDDLTGEIEYASSLFDRTTIRRFEAALTRLFEQVVARDGEITLAELAGLAPVERQQLIEWNAPPLPPSAPPWTLHGRFEVQARLRPDAVAVAAEDGTLTYRELDRRADRLARRLRRMGVGPESPVGLCVERNKEMVVAILAVLKAGGAYVPLDPHAPTDRSAYMLEDAGVSVVLVGEGLDAPVAPTTPTPPRVVRVGPEPASTEDGDGPSLPRDLSPDHLAYVIYTSGSTGRPKGTLITHANVTRLFDTVEPWFEPGPDDVWTLFHSYAFDFSVWELWGALHYGGRLEVVPYWVSRSPESFRDLVRDRRVTVLSQTPSAFKQLIAADAASPQSAPGSLRRVVFGGEMLELASLDPWLRRHGDRAPRLINMYGITETTVHVTYRRLDARDVETAAGSPIGVPIPDLRVQLFDPGGEPVPVGVAGELHVGGPGLARGYLGRPALTAERFVPDPSAGRGPGRGEPGARLYRSGDLARRLADGGLDFLGRIDHQVKIRGFRIEPGEIEAALLRHPAVDQVAVVARTGSRGEQDLVAYLVTPDGRMPDREELRTHVGGLLPVYMVPTRWVVLDALPLTANTKLDRAALPEPDDDDPAAGRQYVPPRGGTETAVAAVFAYVFGVERVGADDDFFALGGHSLLATQAVARIQEALGVQVPLRWLFETPTVAGLSARLADIGSSAPPPVRRLPTEGPHPLSYPQQRMWWIEQMAPGRSTYNIPMSLDLEGPLDIPRFVAAFERISRRHEVLRTRIGSRDGEPFQDIDPWRPTPIPVIDLSALAPVHRSVESRRLARREARRPFDLARSWPARVSLLRSSRERHRALLTLHHIAGDGRSLVLLVDELGAIYRARGAAGAADLPALPVRYADFCHWQRRWLTEERLEDDLAFWRQRLAHLPPVLELPLDRPRRLVGTGMAGRAVRRLPRELSDGLRALGRARRATLFMVLLAAYQELLLRLSGQDDLAVGIPMTGREDPSLEPLIGLFVNTVIVRGRVAPGQTFEQRVDAVREELLAVHENRHVPFERVVEAVAPDRSLEHTPLFQVMFGLEESPARVRRIDQLTLVPADGENTEAKLDLVLGVVDAGDGLVAGFDYDTALFDATTIARALARFECLVRQAVARPRTPLDRLPWLPAAERHQVVAEWNDPGSRAPRSVLEANLADLFDERAGRAPDAVAVEWDGRELSYGALAENARRVARRLRSAGVTPGARVGVALAPGLDLPAVLLGVVRAGAAYVSLDPEYPRERLDFMVEDSGIGVVIGQGAPLDPWRDGRWRAIDLQAEAPHRPPSTATNPSTASPPGGDAPAYVIYTSGSTGRPKGVVVPHRAIVRLVVGSDYVRLGPTARVAQISNTSFDAATFEIWGALLGGGTLVGIDRQLLLSPPDLAREIRRARLTTAFVTTALFNQVAREEPRAFAPLSELLFGGEAVDPVSVRAVLDAAPPRRLLHVYGPTENTTFSTWQQVTAVADDAATVPIGGPIAGSTAYVVDAAGDPVGAGVRGELRVGGTGLAVGYLDRPALTAERFVPDPFDGSPGARLYRTGDVVRLTPDGRIVFVGRVDHQVKIRGFRIEPGEIEARLAEHPQVREVVVLAREDSPGERRLVAYLVASRPPLAVSELRTWLRDRLPEYLVPAHFVELAELPLTPNGKVDRRRLPAPEEAAHGAGSPAEAPATPTEALVAEIWAGLLGREDIGRHDDFFDLGGHSLAAARVLARLREVLGAEVPLRLLFEAPTLARLADAIDEWQATGGEGASAGLGPAPEGSLAPLSYGQEQMWLLQRLDPTSAAYSVVTPLHTRGRFAVDALAGAFAEVGRRHHVLRSRIEEVDGEPVQRIEPPRPVSLPCVDLSALDRASARAQVDALVGVIHRWPYDLAHASVWRVVLLRLGDAEHVVVPAFHHIVSDGWSVGVLVSELRALYPAFASGHPSPLEELPVQYADYARWQRRQLTAESLDREIEYWRDRLAGLPSAPSLRPHASPEARAARRGATVDVELSPETGRAVVELARQERSTPFMVLLAIYDALLWQQFGLEDLVVGAPLTNRQPVVTERLIGYFVNTVLLRTDLSDDPTFRQLVARVRRTSIEDLAHGQLPFTRLAEALGEPPGFHAWFVLQNTPEAEIELPGLHLEPWRQNETQVRHDFKLDLTLETDGAVRGWIEFRASLFELAAISGMAKDLVRWADLAVQHPDLPLSTLAQRVRQASRDEREAARSKLLESRSPGLGAVRGRRRAGVRVDLPEEPRP